MKLSGIAVGDVVEVDKKGRRFFARVDSTDVASPLGEERGPRQLGVSPICREGATITYRTATAREVVGVYRKAAGSA